MLDSKYFADIIRAVQSSLGLAALIVLVAAVVALGLFRKGPAWAQLIAFAIMVVGAGLFIYKVLTAEVSTIVVSQASFGLNCSTGAQDNYTSHAAEICDGQENCSLKVGALGDPFPGCGKTFDITWTCTHHGQRSTHVDPEASVKPPVYLSCP